MKRLWTSIRFKLTVATLLPLMAAIVVCWVIGASIITTRFSRQAQQSVASNLNSAHEILLSDLSRLSDIIRLTGQSSELVAALNEPTLNTVIPTLHTVLRNERLSFLTIIDRYGIVRYRAANPSVSGDSKREDILISAALKGAHSSSVVQLSAVQADRESNQLLPLMSLPVIISGPAVRFTSDNPRSSSFRSGFCSRKSKRELSCSSFSCPSR